MVRLKLQLFAYTGNSIVDYLKSVGKDSSFSARKGLAESNGIKNYTGTASQNTQLLNILRSGGSKATTTTTTNSSNNTATTPASTTINGVNQSTYDKATANFATSEDTNNLKTTADKYANKYYEVANKDNIIDQKYWDTLNSEFKTPEAVTQADAWLTSQLEKIQSGKTSWSDQYKEAINNYLNREKFEYDVDKDQLFHQALASAMNSGKTAMQDTIGQASALTGGYGSTYATSAGNQAYNSFIEDAYNNLPEYYQMALSAYEAEGQEMYNRVAMLGDADATEYGKMVDSYNLTSDRRNQLYNEAYSQFRDAKTDAYNSANLQLNEYGQIVENAYNSAVLSQDQYQTAYQNEFNKWQAEITQWSNIMGLENSDYWQNETFEQTERWNQKDLDYKYAALKQDQDQFDKEFGAKYTSDGKGGYISKTGSGSGSSKLTNTEVATLKKLYTEAGGGDAGLTAVDEHLSIIGKNNLSDEGEAALKSALKGEDVPVYYQNWTISNDTKNGNFLGLSPDDNNDEYSNGTDTMTFKELKKAINNSNLSEEEKEKRIEALRKQSKK